MDLIDKAILIADCAHQNQRDKGGMPYLYHPLRVALHLDDRKAKVVALLHDVVEDSDISLEDLEDDFPKVIIEAVDAITKRSGESYTDYMCRVKSNEIARMVKLEDLKHNMDLRRLPCITELDKKRQAKYQAAVHFLQAN